MAFLSTRTTEWWLRQAAQPVAQSTLDRSTQTLWCCLHAVWTLPFTSTGAFCLRCASTPRGLKTKGANQRRPHDHSQGRGENVLSTTTTNVNNKKRWRWLTTPNTPLFVYQTATQLHVNTKTMFCFVRSHFFFFFFVIVPFWYNACTIRTFFSRTGRVNGCSFDADKRPCLAISFLLWKFSGRAVEKDARPDSVVYVSSCRPCFRCHDRTSSPTWARQFTPDTTTTPKELKTHQANLWVPVWVFYLYSTDSEGNLNMAWWVWEHWLCIVRPFARNISSLQHWLCFELGGVFERSTFVQIQNPGSRVSFWMTMMFSHFPCIFSAK